MRYALQLAYDGTAYHGWQVQENAVSVQGTLQQCLQEIFQIHVELTGCGRTDTGVHASKYIAHFDTDELPANLLVRMNRLLPADIRVQQLQEVNNDFHARFVASSRSYRYSVHFLPDPFLDKYSLLLHKHPDFEAMNEAAMILLTQKRFGSFCKAGGDAKTDFCDVRKARWVPVHEGIWEFQITADRFLRGMVRAITGTLLQVGYGKINASAFQDIVESNDRKRAGDAAPAHGLTLCSITYPEAYGLR